MILDARAPDKPAGVLIDTGTNRRIPYARRANFDTGEYEALVEGPEPDSVIVGDDDREEPVVVRGRAVGKLKLVPLEQAHAFGLEVEPRKVRQTVLPMTADQRIAGLEQYKQVYVKVWNELRRESRRCVDDRWAEYLSKSDFLDAYVLKRRIVPTNQ